MILDWVFFLNKKHSNEDNSLYFSLFEIPINFFVTFFFMHKKNNKIVKILFFSSITDLHVLGWFEHDLAILWKCVYVCITHLVSALPQERMHGISTSYFIRNCRKLVLIRFGCISHNRWGCFAVFCTIFVIDISRHMWDEIS